MAVSGRPRWVIDTSVAVKWFLNEPHSDAAEPFLEAAEKGAIDALAPTSLLFEAANVFWVRRRDGITAQQATAFMQALKLVSLQLVGGDELLPDALALAHDLDISPYDAVFVQLASVSGARLVTADDKLLARIQDRFPAVVRLTSGLDPRTV